ncbi:MAG: immunoglobulin-like domain-containing protein [Arcobacter sp.]|uniref:immunoglobulin-like domain-containing protein n=1 Tax=Arcobacter sp. TaxID=1872629 RepID=UPI003B00C597
MMNLILKQPNGSYEVIKVDKDMVFDPKEGEGFYFDNFTGSDYVINLLDGGSSIELILGTEPPIKLVFNGMVDLITANSLNPDAPKTVLSIINEAEGIYNLQQTVLNPDFKGDDVYASLRELLDQNLASADKSNGVLIDDFGVLTDALSASAAGQVVSDSSTTPPSIDIETAPTFGGRDARPTGSRSSRGGNNSSEDNPPQDVVPPVVTPPTTTGTPTTATVNLSTADVNEDDASVTFTATLTSPAGETPVTIVTTLGTITIAAGESTGTLTVDTQDSDVFVDPDSITATIESATGGNFENLSIGTSSATANIADTIDTTTVNLTADANVTEGGEITYTATIAGDKAPQNDVTVTLSNGETITIEAGKLSGSVTVDAPSDDVYSEADQTLSVTASVDSNDGNYENLVVGTGSTNSPVETVVGDTTDTVTATLTADADAEGGEITYTVTLTDANGNEVKADGEVSVTLDNGETITIADDASKGTVTIDAQSDDVYLDAADVTNAIDTISGGGFENLVANGSDVTVNVADTIDTTTVNLTADANVTEGGEITYTATIAGDKAPQNDVTVTLSNGETITIEAGKLSGSVTVDAPSDDVYSEADQTLSVTASVDSNDGNYENLVVGTGSTNSPVETVVGDTTDTVTATLTADADAEGGEITYTVTLTDANGNEVKADGEVSVTLDNGETITIADDASKGTVTIDAQSDDVYLDAADVTNAIDTISGGGFENLVANGSDVTVNVADTIDTTTVNLTADANVTEGGEITYTATIAGDKAPQNDVTVTLSNGETITIEAGKLSGSVTVDAPSDDVYSEADQTLSVTASVDSNDGNYENLVVGTGSTNSPVETVVGDTTDTVTATLTADADAEGGEITYTVTLTDANGNEVKADGEVSVTLDNGETITIADDASKGTVTIDAQSDDVYLDAADVTNAIDTISGGGFENLVANGSDVTVNVADTIDTTTVNLTADANVTEGGEITYTATIAGDKAPQNDVTVTLSNGETITIEAGKLSGSVTVDAPSDDVYSEADQTLSVTASVDSNDGNYENLVVGTGSTNSPVETVVGDTTDTVTATLTADADAEGGEITYTVTLTDANGNEVKADGEVSVTLDNGETITIADDASKGTVTIDAQSDDVYLDAADVTNAIDTISGGGFENLVANGSDVTVNVADTIDTTTVNLTADANVTEGGEITYTATIAGDKAPQNDVTVTLSNGETITIEAGKLSGSVTVDAPSDDVYSEADQTLSVTASVDSNDGNYENLVVGTGSTNSPVETVVGDTTDTVTATLTADADAEGGEITYTVTLTDANGNEVKADGEVSVTLDNGETITIADDASKGTVTIDAQSDDVYLDAADVTNAIDTISGGGFENLVANGSDVTVNVADTIDTTTVNLTADANVTEGGEITYTATIAGDKAPQNDVTVTLSNGETITIEAGKLSGSVTVDAPSDDVYSEADQTLSVTASVDSNDGNYENLVVGTGSTNSPVETVVGDTTDTVTATLTADADAEGGEITYTVTLTDANGNEVKADGEVSVTLDNGETITIADDASKGTVTIDAQSDDVYLDAADVTNAIDTISGGGFENLVANGSDVTVNVADTIDTTTVNLTADANVTEGGEITYTATIAGDKAPQNDVTVTLSNGETITIEAGKLSGSVTVDAPSDDVYSEADQTLSVTASVDSNDGNYENLVVGTGSTNSPVETVVGDTTDTVTATLTADADAEGGEITYTVTLTDANGNEVKADGEVSVTLDNGETITIADDASKGTVTIDAQSDDVYLDAADVTNAIDTISGGGFENLVANGSDVTVNVADTIDTTTVNLTADANVTEGGEITYTATIAGDKAPQNDVTVTLSNGETITIEAGKLSGSVTVDAPSDDVYSEADQTLSVTASVDSNDGNYENLVVGTGSTNSPVETVVGDTTDTVTATLTADADAEGGEITYTVTLTDANGNEVKADGEVSVTLDNGETITIADDASKGTVTIDAQSDDVYLDAADVTNAIDTISGGGFENLVANGSDVTVNVADTIDTTTVNLTADANVTEGGEITYTATIAGDKAPQNDVTVTLSNGETITIEAGKLSGSVTVDAPSDDVYSEADQTLSVTASVDSNDGNYENLVVGTGSTNSPVETVVGDTTDTVTATLTADADAEGGEITYTVTLTDANGNEVKADGEVSVTLDNGETITIADDASKGTVTIDAQSDDVYLDAADVTNAIDTISGGGFENLVANGSDVTVNVADTIDTTTVNLTADANVTEGGEITYTATIAGDKAPQNDVTVTLSNGETITIEAGKLSGSVTVDAPSDDVYSEADQTLSVTASVDSNDGNYENLVVGTGSTNSPVETVVGDTTDTVTATLTADADAEGGEITYTVTLTDANGNEVKADGEVSVTLDNGETITIADDASKGTVTIDAQSDDVYLDAADVTNAIDTISGGGFENLVANGSDVTVNVADTIDTTTVNLTADANVTEGGEITYTATIAGDKAPQNDVTVTLSNGETITIEAGKLSGSVTVDAPSDDVYSEADQTLSVTASVDSNDGNYENLVVGTGSTNSPVETVVGDTTDTVTATLTADADAEGGEITYTVTLTDANGNEVKADGEVSVTLDNGETITIADDASKGTVTIDAQSDDVYLDAADVTNAIDTISGGGFENLVANGSDVTVNVADTIDTTTVNLTADANVTEGGEITYTATIAGDKAPQNDVTVTLSNGETITIEAGKLSGSVTVDAPSDDVYSEADQTLSVTASVDSNDGNYENLVVGTGSTNSPVETVVGDTTDTVTATLTADADAEGGEITYTVTLTDANGNEVKADGEVSVTLDNGETITIADDASKGTVTIDAQSDDVYLDAADVTNAIDTISGGGFENLVANGSDVTVNVADTIDTTTVNLTADANVTEGGEITYTATIAGDKAPQNDVTVTLSNGETITIEAGKLSGSVTVDAPSDDVYSEADQTLSVTASVDSNDGNYENLVVGTGSTNSPVETVVGDTTDTVTATLTADADAEGGEITYTVTLTDANGNEVKADGEVSVTLDNGETITIADDASKGTVTIDAQSDDVYLDAADVTNAIDTISGGGFENLVANGSDVTVNVADTIDTTTVNLTADANVTEGGEITYTATIAGDKAPQNDVTVTLSNGETITIEAGKLSGSVTVDAPSDDVYSEADQTLSVTASVDSNDGNYENLVVGTGSTNSPVETVVGDTTDTVTATLTADADAEGGEITYTVTLTDANGNEVKADGEVSVTLDNGETITIADDASKGTVTIDAQSDDVYLDAADVTNAIDTISGGGFENLVANGSDVTVNVADTIDTTTVNLTADANVTEGGEITYTATIAGDKAPQNDVTVTLSNGETITIEAGKLSGSVTVDAPSDDVYSEADQTLSVTASVDSNDGNYENLVVGTGSTNSPVETVVGDTTDTVTATLTADADAEGGEITYTVTLTDANGNEVKADGEVSVTLDNGETITIADDASKGTVTIDAQSDDVYLDAADVTNAIDTISGGGFENLVANGSDVTVNVADTIDTTTVNLTADANVTEGGEITYTATIAGDKAPQNDVTVTLSNGETITIEAGKLSGSVTVDAPSDDVYSEADQTLSVTASVDSNDGNYENLVVGTGSTNSPVETVVGDTTDTVTATLTADADAEGGEITYTVTLTDANGNEVKADGEVSVTLDNGETITIADDASKGTVTIDAQSDDVYLDAADVTNAIDTISGGGFENLVANGSDVTVNVADTIDTTTVNLTADANVTEGGEITYTATIAGDKAPQNDVTVTLSNGETITIEAGKLSGSVTVDAPSDDVYSEADQTLSVTASVDSNDGNYENLVVGTGSTNSPVETVVGDTTDTVTATLTADADAEGGEITYTVTLTDANGNEVKADGEVSVTLDNGETITIADDASKGTVTIDAQSDDVYLDAADVTNAIDTISGGGFENLVANGSDVTVNVADTIDTTTVNLTADANVTEGGEITYTATIAGDKAPQNDVTVTLSNGETITIEAGKLSGSVTVDAPSDDVYSEADQTLSVTASVDSNDGNYENLVVGTGSTNSPVETVVGDTTDTVTATLTADADAEGGEITYTVTLTDANGNEVKADGEVSVTLDNGETITIADDASKGTVTIDAQSDDVYLDAADVTNAIDTISGGGFENLVANGSDVTVNVADTIDTTTVNLTADANVTEGGEITYTATIAGDKAPQNDVTVTLSNGETITIEAGKLSGSVTVDAPSDDVYSEADQTLSVTASVDSNDGNYENLVVGTGSTNSPVETVVGDTTDTVTATLTADADAEGGEITYTVTLTDANGNEVKADGEVSVTLDNGETITIADDASKGTVTIDAQSDDVYLDAADVTNAIDTISGGGFENLVANGSDVTVNVADTIDTTTVNLTADANVTEGGEITYTATIAGDKAPQNDVTVTLSNGETITIEAGKLSGSVTVDAPSDDVYSEADQTLSVTASVDSNDGNYENLVVGTGSTNSPVETVVGDTTDTVTATLTADADAEGGEITYTVTLTDANGNEVKADGEVSVTLDNGETITIADDASKGTVTIDAQSDDVYLDAADVTNAIDTISGGGFENLVANGSDVTVNVADTIDTTTVNLTADANVTEGGEITYTATIAGDKAPQNDVTVTLSNGETITIEAGKLSGSVTVDAPSDDVYSEADQTLSVTASVDSNDGNYENLVVGTGSTNSPVETVVGDTTDTVTATLTADADAEGGEITYTVTLTDANGNEVKADGEVSVTLDNGETITIADDASKGTVTIDAQSDDVYLDAADVTNAIDTISGGGFENLVANGSDVTVNVADTIDTTTVNLTADANVTEGGEITYTATIAGDKAPQNDVTVTLSNGETITIEAGKLSGSVTVDAPSDDVYSEADQTLSVTASVDSNDGNYENLVVGTGSTNSPVETVVGDTTDTVTATLTADADAEGGEITYTVTLTDANGNEVKADGEVSVTLDNGETITIADDASKGTVTIDAQSDDVYLDAADVTNAIDTISGGGFENLVANGSDVTVNVADTIDTTTVNLTADANVTEGGEITYTATIAGDKAPQNDVTVTLSNGETITIEAGKLSGSVTVDAPSDDVYSEADQTLSVTASVDSNDGNYENLVVGTGSTNSPVETVVGDTTDTVTATLTADADAEGGEITYTVTLTDANGNEVKADGEVSVTLDNGETITIADDASKGTVTIDAQSDDVYLDAADVTNAIDTISGGGFENLVANGSDVTVNVADTIDTTTVNLTADANVTEGGEITYTATIAGDKAPQNDVTVTLSNGETITIEAGKLSGSVTVDAPSDDVYSEADQTLSVTASVDSNDGNYENLVVGTGSTNSPVETVVGDTTDTVTATLTADADAEGGEITYTVTLTDANGNEVKADGEVSVTLDNGETITIADDASKGTVTIDAQSDDVYLDAADVTNAIDTISGGGFENLVANGSDVTVNVADTIDTTTVNLTADANVTEGGEITYTATIAGDKAPQNDVTVTLSNGETITIEAGKLSGSVTVDAPSDDVYSEADQTLSVTASVDSNDGNYENLVVGTGSTNSPVETVVGDTTDTVTATLTADADAEGGEITYTVTLTDANGNEVKADGEVSVTLDNGETITIADDASKGTVTIDAQSDDVYLDAADVTNAIDTISGGGFENLVANGSDVTVNVADTIDTTTVNLTADANVTEGGEITYTATIAGDKAPQNDVTVTLSNGETITIEAGKLSGSVTVDAPSDDVYSEADQTLSVTASVDSNDGNYENLVVGTGSTNSPVETVVGDTATDTTLTLNDVSVNEGAGTATVGATLTSTPTDGPLVITLDNGSTITFTTDYVPGTIVESTPFDVQDNDVYNDSESYDISVETVSGGDEFENLVTTDSATVTVSDTTDLVNLTISGPSEVKEGKTAKYTIEIDEKAQTDVTIKVVTGHITTESGDIVDVTQDVVIKANQTKATISVETVKDSEVEGNEDFKISIAKDTSGNYEISGGNFENLVVSNDSVTTTIIDKTVNVHANSVVVDEDALIDTNDNDGYATQKVATGDITLDNVDQVLFSTNQTTTLTSNGKEITLTVSANGKTLVGETEDSTVFTATLSEDGTSYTFELMDVVDHMDTASEDAQTLGLKVIASNDENSEETTLDITIADDVVSIDDSNENGISLDNSQFTNLIINGSFEDITGHRVGGSGNKGFIVDQDISGGNWSGMQSMEGWQLMSPTSEWMEPHEGAHASVGTADGSNYMDLGETNNSGDSDVENTHIGQIIGGVQDDVVYELNFAYADKAFTQVNESDSGVLEVYWGGELIQVIEGNQEGWNTSSIEVVGGSGDGTNRLEFKEVGEGSDNWGMAIDDISMIASEVTTTGTLDDDANIDVSFGADGEGTFSLGELDSWTLSSDKLTLSKDDGSATVSIDSVSGNYSITQSASLLGGQINIPIIATDGDGDAQTTSLILNPTNLATDSLPENIYVQIDDAQTTEGGTLVHKITLVDENGNEVRVPAGEWVEVNLNYTPTATNGAQSSDYASQTTVRVYGGTSGVFVFNDTIEDTIDENNESYIVSVSGIDSSNEAISSKVTYSDTATGEIIDDDVDNSTTATVSIVDASDSNDVIDASEGSAEKATISGQIEVGATITALSVTDGNSTIEIDPANVTINNDGTFTIENFDVSSLNDGELTVNLSSEDTYGNTASASDTVDMDTIANITIDNAEITSTADATYTAYAYNGDNFMTGNFNNPGSIKLNSVNETAITTEYGVGIQNNQNESESGIDDNETLLVALNQDSSSATFKLNVPASESFEGGWVAFDSNGDAITVGTFESNGGDINLTIDDLGENFAYIAFDAHTDNGQASDSGFYVEPVSFVDGNGNTVNFDSTTETLDISGTTTDIESGQTINIELTDGVNTVTTTVQVQNDGSYSLEDYDVSELSSGEISINVTTTDVAGNPATVDTTITLVEDSTSSMADAIDQVPESIDETQTLEISDNSIATNLVLTFDVSGSMKGDKLELAKESTINMIDKYSELGDVKVMLTSFANYGQTLTGNIGSVWLSVSEAKAYINGFTADGGTNYDDALVDVTTAMNSETVPTSDQMISYFVSDGKPTYNMADTNNNGTYETRTGNGYDTTGVTDAIADTYKALSFTHSYAVGIGDDSLTQYLSEIVENNNVIVVDDANDLNNTLSNTVSSDTISGNILDNVSGGDGDITLTKITMGDTDYTSTDMPITTAEGATLNIDFTTGDYTYSGSSNNFSADVSETFVVTARDEDGDTTAFNVNINVVVPVVDATPESIDETQTLSFDGTAAAIATNVVITLDVSGSMTNNHEDVNRLALAKEALENMINEYESQGSVNVKLVTFNSEGQAINNWMSAEDAISAIDDLSAGGYTNYEDAVYETYHNYSEPSADRTVAYFISDGEPTKENNEGYDQYYNTGSDYENGWLDSSYQNGWNNFVDTYVDSLHVIAMGSGISDTSYLDVLAQAGDVETTVVTDSTQLSLSIPSNDEIATVNGNILDNVSGGDGEITLTKISIGGTDYTSADMPITTPLGATLAVNFATGAYIYSVNSSDFTSDVLETFNVTASDEDGDTTSFNVGMNVIAPTSDNNDTSTPIEDPITENAVNEGDGRTNHWDELETSDNDDVIIAGDNWNDVDLEKGDDNLTIGDGDSTNWSKIDADKGDDNIKAGDNWDEIKLGSGDDTLQVGDANSNNWSSIDAGKGDDIIKAGDNWNKIDGGKGEDTLVLTNEDIDLGSILEHTQIKSIENLDLTNGQAQEISINLDDILNIEDNDNELKIFGDSDDKVTLEGGDEKWSSKGQEEIDGETFNVYEGISSNVKVLIDDDVSIDPDF